MTLFLSAIVLATLIAAAVAYVSWTGYLNVVEARARLRRGALLLDVDPEDAFARRHLPGAVNVPVEDMAGRQRDIGPPSRSIVVYAREELRSAHAAHVLRVLGYRTVISLGAMKNW